MTGDVWSRAVSAGVEPRPQSKLCLELEYSLYYLFRHVAKSKIFSCTDPRRDGHPCGRGRAWRGHNRRDRRRDPTPINSQGGRYPAKVARILRPQRELHADTSLRFQPPMGVTWTGVLMRLLPLWAANGPALTPFLGQHRFPAQNSSCILN